MTDERHKGNGPVRPLLHPVPTRPPIPTLKRLRTGAGYDELAESLATTSAAFAQHVPAIYEENNEMRAAINMLDRRVASGFDEILRRLDPVEDETKKLRDSHNDLSEHLADEVAGRVDDKLDDIAVAVKEIKTSPGFPVPGTLLERKSDSVRVQSIVDAHEWRRDAETLRAWKKWLAIVAATVVAAIIIGALTFMWRLGVEVDKARSEGMETGAARARAEAAAAAAEVAQPPAVAPPTLPPPPPPAAAKKGKP